MKQSLTLTLLGKTLAVCAALIALTGASAQAQTPGTDLQPSMTLMTSQSITQGEPIILKYSVTNTSDAMRYIGMKEDCSNWLSLKLTNAAGHTIIGHPVSNPNRMDPDRSFALNANAFSTPGSINEHSTLPGYVVANQWFPTLAPGKYTLAAHVHLFYRVVSTSLPEEGEVAEQDSTFPLVVTTADSVRLQSAAQDLEKTVLKVGPGEPIMKRNMLIQALFSMPSAQATPSWQDLIADPASTSWMLLEAVDNLTCLRSAAATDVLMGMLLHPTPAQDKYVRSAVIAAMGGTYRDANPDLRQHIKMLYDSNGIPLGNIIAVPSSTGGGN